MSYYSEPDGQLTLLELLSPENTLVLPKQRSASKSVTELVAIPYLYLDLSSDHVDLFGNHYWELRSPHRDGKPPLNTGPAPREPIRSSLAEILEENPEKKYYLSKTACMGILRRAEERGKALPSQLQSALMAQAGLNQPSQAVKEIKAYHINQHDEVRVPHDTDAVLNDESGIKQQTLVAGFSAGAGASAGGIGYSEIVAPTLKGSASGNCMPSVLCLNDQGGSIMECSENITGTLRAQEHGHQPLVYENHGIDARYTGPHRVAPTLSARAGTGGNNLPLVGQEIPEAICIMGPAIDRQPHNGGNGLGYQKDISYTLTATDHHAVFSRQRVDKFVPDNVTSTESARQHKDATDLVLQIWKAECPLLIRRLTPLECERLQGFPDGWTNIPSASDSARYKALGNSVAIPCVEFILRGIIMTAKTA